VIIPDVILIQLSSWEWAQSYSKHVDNSNKYIIKKLCLKLVTHQNYTKMHSPKNIKKKSNCDFCLSSCSCQGVSVIDSKLPTVTCCGTQNLSIYFNCSDPFDNPVCALIYPYVLKFEKHFWMESWKSRKQRPRQFYKGRPSCAVN